MARRHFTGNRVAKALTGRKQDCLLGRNRGLRPEQTRHQYLQYRPEILRRAATQAVSECHAVLRFPHQADAFGGRVRTWYVLSVIPYLGGVLLTRVTGRNTVLCRMVHQNMVSLRPAVHCPHIGPSGGGYCVDTPSYTETVEANYFSNYKFAYGNGSLDG